MRNRKSQIEILRKEKISFYRNLKNQISEKRKNHEKLLPYIKKWISDEKPYTKRVAMLFLKKYFLDEDYRPEYLEEAAKIRSDEYYVNMMTAWLFADALVKQWDSAVVFLQEKRLDNWTHNKTIQKARESFRITEEQKEYLKGLKV